MLTEIKAQFDTSYPFPQNTKVQMAAGETCLATGIVPKGHEVAVYRCFRNFHDELTKIYGHKVTLLAAIHDGEMKITCDSPTTPDVSTELPQPDVVVRR